MNLGNGFGEAAGSIVVIVLGLSFLGFMLLYGVWWCLDEIKSWFK